MTFREYLASLRGKTVAVIGCGVSNRPLLRALASSDAQVCAYDRKTKEALGEFGEELDKLGIGFVGGDDYLSALHGVFDSSINKEIERRKYDLMSQISKYEALSPLKRLEQGFSYSRFKDGGNISSVKNVKTGDEIEIVVKDGIIEAVTQSIKNN